MKQKTYLQCFFLVLSLSALSILLVDICTVVFSLNGMDSELGWKIICAFWYTVPPLTLCFLLLTKLILEQEGGYFFIIEDETQQRKLKTLLRIWCVYVPLDWLFELLFYEVICSTGIAERIYELSCSRAFFALVMVLFCSQIFDLSGYLNLKTEVKLFKHI